MLTSVIARLENLAMTGKIEILGGLECRDIRQGICIIGAKDVGGFFVAKFFGHHCRQFCYWDRLLENVRYFFTKLKIQLEEFIAVSLQDSPPLAY